MNGRITEQSGLRHAGGKKWQRFLIDRSTMGQEAATPSVEPVIKQRFLERVLPDSIRNRAEIDAGASR